MLVVIIINFDSFVTLQYVNFIVAKTRNDNVRNQETQEDYNVYPMKTFPESRTQHRYGHIKTREENNI